jgi:Bacterial protein of unknown function (DUF899)
VGGKGRGGSRSGRARRVRGGGHVADRPDQGVCPGSRLAEHAAGFLGGNSYSRDYHGEDDGGEQLSKMNVFSRSGGQIRHFYGTEQADPPPGQDDRHVDLLWPLWNLLDLTPGGRGDWRPAYSRPAGLEITSDSASV